MKLKREGTPWVKNSQRGRRLRVAAGGGSLISTAGGSLLAETARTIGLDRVLSAALRPWRAGHATHDPGKIVADLAMAIAVGGDCLADVAVLRSQPDLWACQMVCVSPFEGTIAHDWYDGIDGHFGDAGSGVCVGG